MSNETLAYVFIGCSVCVVAAFLYAAWKYQQAVASMDLLAAQIADALAFLAKQQASSLPPTQVNDPTR